MEKISGELELAKKKKEALDKLLNQGKVSQTTYDSFSNEVATAINEIEAKQNALVEKMKSKIGELEQQMKTLEFLREATVCSYSLSYIFGIYNFPSIPSALLKIPFFHNIFIPNPFTTCHETSYNYH